VLPCHNHTMTATWFLSLRQQARISLGEVAKGGITGSTGFEVLHLFNSFVLFLNSCTLVLQGNFIVIIPYMHTLEQVHPPLYFHPSPSPTPFFRTV
jgi:hypothetical protein